MSVADRLPPDILSDIFVAARVASVLDALVAARFEAAPWDLLTFTSTSRVWRAAALARRRLWTTVFTSYTANIARWMIENSRGDLLELPGDFDGIRDACAVVLEQPARVRELRLMSNAEMAPIMSMDAAQELQAVIEVNDRFPHLETLHFWAFPNPPDTSSLRTLTELVLDGVRTVGATTVPPSPQLRLLAIRNSTLDRNLYPSGMSDYEPTKRPSRCPPDTHPHPSRHARSPRVAASYCRRCRGAARSTPARDPGISEKLHRREGTVRGVLKKMSVSAGDWITHESGYARRLCGELQDVDDLEMCERESPFKGSWAREDNRTTITSSAPVPLEPSTEEDPSETDSVRSIDGSGSEKEEALELFYAGESVSYGDESEQGDIVDWTVYDRYTEGKMEVRGDPESASGEGHHDTFGELLKAVALVLQ